jgi:hypothetical protein
MWVFLNNSFLSIVDPAPELPPGAAPRLLVRARIKGDIEAVFPKAKVTCTPGRDYRFRALLPRAEVAAVIAEQVESLGYNNFKSSVPDRPRHDAYLGVWGVMHREQQRRIAPPKAKGKRGGFDYLLDYPGDRV